MPRFEESSAATAASAVSITDSGGYYAASNVETALQEVLAGVFAQTNYTPALTASTTNPTLGSGSTAAGRYMRIGNLVIAWGVIIFGTSGVNAGSGNYRISLPVTASINLGSMRIGQIIINDSSTSANFTVGSAIILDGEETYFYMQRTGASTFVSNSSPITWSTSDDVSWVLAYPAG